MNSRHRFEVVEIDRRLANMVRSAVVTALDAPAGRVRVRDGDWVSDWLPWLETRAHAEASFSPPRPGEQVMVLCPSGDAEQGVVLAGIASTAWALPASDPAVSVYRWSAGGFRREDGGGNWLLEMPAAGSITLRAGASSLVIDNAGIRLLAPRIDLN